MVQGSHVVSADGIARSVIPVGWYLYAATIGGTSLMIALGLQHSFFSLLRQLSVPQTTSSVLTGLLNLSWFELSYVVGGGLKSVSVFLILPYVGCASGLLSALLLLTNWRFRRHVLSFHLALSVLVGILSLGVLSWRLARGYGDLWRISTTVSFLFSYLCWIQFFRKTSNAFSDH